MNDDFDNAHDDRTILQKIRAKQAKIDRIGHGETVDGLTVAWSPVNQAWFILFGVSSYYKREVIGIVNTVEERDQRLDDLVSA